MNAARNARAAQRMGAEPRQTALTVNADPGALAARLYHESIGLRCLASAPATC
jgi:hypothetical protein